MSNGKGSLKAPFFFLAFLEIIMSKLECFSARDAVLKFKEVTGFNFSPILVGMILKYSGAESVGYDSNNSKLYPAMSWKYLWNGLHFKAYKRTCYQTELSYSFGYSEIPPMPQAPLYLGVIRKFKKSHKSSP